MSDKQEPTQVVITDIKIPFWSLVLLLLKVIIIASIPAAIIIGVTLVFSMMVLGVL